MKVNKKGFTMVEILITVAIIAVLAGIAIPVVTHYMNAGRNDYNEKLKDQLLISGKEYYTDNRQKLPVKDYRGVYRDGKNFSYVSLPEMQSNNYISKEFVDSEGNECTESYVYVKQKINSSEYDWHACLRCTTKEGKEINYSEEDLACNITDWEDNEKPTCNIADAVYTKATVTDGIVYNPETLKLKGVTEDRKIAYIEIINKTTEEPNLGIKLNDNSEITQKEIISYIKSHMKEGIEGEYEINVVDAGGNSTANNCAKFIIDNTKPKVTYTVDKSPQKDGWYVPELKVTAKCTDEGVINTLKNQIIQNDKTYTGQTTLTDTIKTTSKSTMPKEYTTTCEDKAGNKATTPKNYYVRNDSYTTGDPIYCKYTTPSSSWLGINKTTNMTVTCYVPTDKTATIDANKIVLKNSLGTLSKASTGVYNAGTNKVVEYKLTYTASKTNQTGSDNIIINEGFVTAGGQKNKKITSGTINVDTKAPVITITNSKNGVWTNANVKITVNSKDTGGSGLTKVEYSTNNKTWSAVSSFTTNTTANKIYTPTLSSTQTYYVRATDKVGNAGKQSTSIKIDKTKPTISFSRSGTTVTIKCKDTGGSGLKSKASTKKTIKTGANRKVTGTCTDKAGNSKSSSKTYKWSSCATGKNTCRGGYVYGKWYVSYYGIHDSCVACGQTIWYSSTHYVVSGPPYHIVNGCCDFTHYKRSSYYSSCATGKNTCKGGFTN